MTERAPLAIEFAAAARALAAMRAGQTLPAALDDAVSSLAPDSHAPVRAMAHEAVRSLGLLDALAALLNQRAPQVEVAALQAVALAQLLTPARLRAPAVVVDQAVAAARSIAGNAGGFLNATLRRFLRERDALMEQALQDPVARWNHPGWWIERLRRDHPQHWQQVLEVDNSLPPMTLRVNRRRGSRDAYQQRLAAAGMDARPAGESALVLARPCDVGALPGWENGDVSVQDAGAQLAAQLLAPRDGERVLDACAAPGGKTTHLLERADCLLTAVDVDAERLESVRQNLARAKAQARVIAADASRVSGWWDGVPFDAILLDAPCTASGIVRRHPDVCWLRRRGDVATLARRQSELLHALWPLLRPGGRLLYATCSVFRQENESVIGSFAGARPDAMRQPLQAVVAASMPAQPIAQLLPTSTDQREHDGFFYAMLEKRR